MGKYINYSAPKGEKTDWIHPIMEKYKLCCCDCGLVHNFDFRVYRVTEYLENGEHHSTYSKNDKLKVAFRVSRNNKSTGQIRRHMKAPKDIT